MRKLSLVVVALVAMCLVAAQVQAGVIAADGFTNVAGPRDAGDPLGGTTTEVGAKTWVAYTESHASYPAGPFVFTDLGNITQQDPGAGKRAFVTSAYIDFTYTLPLLTVAADVKVRTDSNTWWTVGFNTTNAERLGASSELNLLWKKPGAAAEPNNGWALYSNGAELASGTCAELNCGNWNEIKLSYKPATGWAEVIIGGTSRWSGDTGVTFTPTYVGIGAALLSGAAGTRGEADNFELSETPEPATLGFMGLGLAAVFALRKKR